MKITLLARAQSLAIFTRGVEDTGMQALFRAHHKEATMAVHVSQIGQIEIPPVGQEQSAFEALRRRQIVLFGVGVGGQDDGDVMALQN